MRCLLTAILLGGMVLVLSGQVLAQKDWTVMVYMAADNNLEEAAIKDINEMESVGSTAEVDIVVQIDRIPGYDPSNGDWTSTRRYYIVQDFDQYTINSSLISDLGEKNMGDPATLSDFVSWGMTNYPASHYFLIIWNHGYGWQLQRGIGNIRDNPDVDNKGLFAQAPFLCKYFEESHSTVPSTKFPPSPFGRIGFKSAGSDKTNGGDKLFNYEIESALRDHPKLDILGFDACVMAMIEVAYQLRDQASFMIASEELEPGDGWPYDQFLNGLALSPTYSPAQLCSLVVLHYYDYWTTHLSFLPLPGEEAQQTLSAVDLAQIRTVATKVNEMADAVVGGDSWSVIMSILPGAEQFGRTEPFYDLYDIADLLAVNLSDQSIVNSAIALKEAISDAILINRNETGHQYAHGLSVYFPQESEEFDMRYLYLPEFADSTNWLTFLTYYFNDGTYVFDYLEPNDVVTQAGWPVDPQYVYESFISHLDDVDCWLVNSGIPETITIILEGPPDADLDLHLYDAAGQSLLESGENRGNGVPDTITYSSTSEGFYYVMVSGYNSFSLAPYQLSFDLTGYNSGWFRLSYDDNVPDGEYFSVTAGDIIGSSFTLPQYPMILDGVWINHPSLSGAGGGDGSFYLLLYDNYGYVVNPFSLGPLTPPGTGWSYLDLTEYSLPIYSRVFVGIWYDGVNTPTIGCDSNPSGRDYYYDANSQTWLTLNKSLFIRLDVRYPVATGVVESNDIEMKPSGLLISQNYPNPFNASTVIAFETQSYGPVKLEIFNILGQRVFIEELEVQSPGSHSFAWGGRDQLDNPVPSGVYFYRVSADGVTESRKMVLLK